MKQKNSKIYWLVFVGIILIITIIVFCIWLPYKNKTKAPESNKNNNSYLETLLNAPDAAEQAVLQENIRQYSEAIAADPNDVKNYINKSEAEYLSGDKTAALETVNEGLVVNPNNELLKSRKDVLEKDYLNNSNIDATRE